MLKSIDVLIGLVVVLLALSMAVTVITQSITTIINSRGRHLRRGLADLLQQLDPALTVAVSEAVATRLLTHPLVCGSTTPIAADGSATGVVAQIRRLVGGRRLGNVVHREEFTKLLMVLATERGSSGLDTTSASALKTALRENGIADPDAALKAIRTQALRLERANPELSHVARQNLAILQQAESDFVAKINNWFDQTMDRTSQRFTASTRAITFAGAFLVAIGMQVDTLSLINRLSADDKLRDAFVQEAIRVNEGPAAAESTSPVSPENAKAQEYRAFLAEYGVLKLPGAGSGEWWESLENANHFGLLITALLLTLGAPFWYSTLGSLLQLRSVIAVKDDAQRSARQSRDAAGPAATNTALPAAGGER